MNRRIESQKISPDDFNVADATQQVVNEVSRTDDVGFFIVNDYPTNGMMYPEGTVIKARPLKVLEVKMLSQMDEETADDVVNDILRRTVVGINIDDVFVVDKLYFVFWLRANTYKDSGFEVDFKCPLCKKNSTFNFGIDTLNIRNFDDDKLKEFQNEIVLPQTNTKFTIGLLTIKDERDNKKFIKDHKKSLMNFDDDILALCKMVKTINGKKLGMIEKYMYLTEELTAGDYAYLESFVQEKSVGLEPMINVVCNECGGSTESVLPFRPDFFLPKVSTGRHP